MEEYEEETNEDIKWRALGPKDRVKFLKNLFSDEDWYDGTPFFQGGESNPDFQTICDRSGAPMSEVKTILRKLAGPTRIRPEASNANRKTEECPSKQHGVIPIHAEQLQYATCTDDCSPLYV